MDVLQNPAEFLSVMTAALLLFLSYHRALQLHITKESDEDYDSDIIAFPELPEACTSNAKTVTTTALYAWRLWNSLGILDRDLGIWVKPRSTMWFSQFLIEQYNDDRWVKMFCLTKDAVFSLAALLRPTIEKKDTKYRLAIPIVVRLACTLFKLTHGVSLLICNEMFAVGRSTLSMLLRDVVHAINVVLRSKISWPYGGSLMDTEQGFQQLCSLPGVVGAIDVVDSNKRFLDLFVGMPGSTNDSRMLRRSSLYQKSMQNTLWDDSMAFRGFSPYILGDLGYSLLPWRMIPHNTHRQLPIVDSLFNKKQRKGRGVVENAFALLKQSFRELLVKSYLHVTFIPDVIVACAILYNLLLQQSRADITRLLNVLRTEGFQDEEAATDAHVMEAANYLDDETRQQLGLHKRRDLGVYLALQHIAPL